MRMIMKNRTPIRDTEKSILSFIFQIFFYEIFS